MAAEPEVPLLPCAKSTPSRPARIPVALALATSAACQAAPLPAPGGATPEVELVLAFRPDATEVDRAALRERHARRPAVQLLPGAERWRVGSMAAIATIAAEPTVKFVHPNYRRRLVLPGDPPASPLRALAALHPGDLAGWTRGPETNDPRAGRQ